MKQHEMLNHFLKIVENNFDPKPKDLCECGEPLTNSYPIFITVVQKLVCSFCYDIYLRDKELGEGWNG